MTTDNNMKKTKNGILYEKNGWKYVSIWGEPKERGRANGFLLADEFKKIQEMLNFTVYHDFGIKWDFFIEAGKNHLKDTIKKNFEEYYEEMEGMSDGCNEAGVKTTVDEIIAWNNFYTLTGSWFANSEEGKALGASAGKEGGGAKDRCSAFIAVGDYTKHGKIVLAHNSFCTFIDGQYANVILDIKPTKGNRILMQSCACWIWSGMDFYVTSAGIVCTETTIGGFFPYENNFTVACRIRKAMQYAKTLDECDEMLWEGNSGDYANSWLFGDINTNEIMRIELGLKYKNVEKTKNGYFIGFNAPYDPRIRCLECANTGYDDLRRHQGARKVRLADLMDESKGKLDANLAMQYIADHYDVYLQKENNPCSRTVCSHYELDARKYMSDPSRPKPFVPRGAVDGVVADSEMVKNMSFMARWGSSCGTPFIVEEFIKKNRIWEEQKPYLHDRPEQPWTLFTVYKESGEEKKHGKNFGKKYRTRGRKGKTRGRKTRKNAELIEETTSTDSAVTEDKPAEMVEEVVNRDELIENVAKE